MRQARESVRQAIEREKASTWRTADQQIGVYVAVGGDDLRAVSRTFYGTPHEWRRLMTYNGLSSSLCTAGQVLLIPPLVEGAV